MEPTAKEQIEDIFESAAFDKEDININLVLRTNPKVFLEIYNILLNEQIKDVEEKLQQSRIDEQNARNYRTQLENRLTELKTECKNAGL